MKDIDKFGANYKLTPEQIEAFQKDDVYSDWLKNAKSNNEEIQKTIDKENKIEELENKYKYLLADFENYKKRSNKTLSDCLKYKNEDIILRLLDIKDELDLYYKNNQDEDIPSFNKINSIINDIFEKNNVKKVYDGKRPIMTSEYDDVKAAVPVKDKALDNSIVDVIKTGYKYQDKVIRYEEVIINKFNK